MTNVVVLKNPFPSIHEIYNFCEAFLVYRYYVHVLNLPAFYIRVEDKIFKDFYSLQFLAINLCPIEGKGHEIYNLCSPYPTNASSMYQIWYRLAY